MALEVFEKHARVKPAFAIVWSSKDARHLMTMNRSLSPGAVQDGGPKNDGANRTVDCLTTDEILELLLGTLPEGRRDAALEHIAKCAECRVLFSSAAQALDDTGPVAPYSPVGVFQPGMLVANRYHVERFLARGGMGEVYAVRDEVLSERIALKTVRSQTATDVKSIRRLKSEALLSRRIGHAHVCRIFDFGEHEMNGAETICFLTMELVEGETLGARVRRDGPLPVDLIRVILRQVLGGLAEAHALGIVHRDLKSDNIMLRNPTPSGASVEAVVMDFGLAFRVDADDRLTSDTHALVGSAAYMAPEQVEGQRLTSATDVYALGVILFEMLTGQLPFQAGTPVSTAMQRLHNAPPLPSSLRAELGTHWDDLVMRCLQRGIEHRFASAREFMAALDRLEATAAPGLPATTTTSPSETRPSVSHRHVVAIVAAGTVMGSMLWGVVPPRARSSVSTGASPRAIMPVAAPVPSWGDSAVVSPMPSPVPRLKEAATVAAKSDAPIPGTKGEAQAEQRAKGEPHPRRARTRAARPVPKPTALPSKESEESEPRAGEPAPAGSHDGTARSPTFPNAAPLWNEPGPSPLEPLPLDPDFPE